MIDVEATLAKLDQIQHERGELSKAFAVLLTGPEVANGISENHRAFTALVLAAVREYGIRQTAIGEKLGVTSAAVSRWMHGLSLPAPYARATILRTIAELVIERQDDMDSKTQKSA